MNLSSLDSQRLMLSWPGVLVFALATWGILAKPSRLDSRRPVEPRPTSASASKSGEIPSRLWDSPFSSLPPVEDGNPNDNRPTAVGFSDQLQARLRQLNADSYRRFTVAAVCMPSPHSSEDLEQARRRRWAVVSALHASGAVPLHPDRIELAELTANTRDESNKETSRKFRVPHEWFAIPGSKSTAAPPVCEQLVAVVWLDEAQLGDRPLDDLSLLLKAIEGEPSPASGENAGQLTFAILGPLTSNMLASFAKDWNPATNTSRSWPSRTLLINTDATSERARSAIDAAARAPAKKAPRTGKDETRSPSPLILHTIGTDADLARRTVKELVLRRSSTNSASVALLAEWDTDYGRDVLPTFRQAFKDEDGADHDASRLWEFTFPRGLDGTPVVSTGNKKVESGDSDLEFASGAAQLDYLRRLVTRLKDRPVDEPPLRAIGILASDVYDKLLLLRALRDEFPNVVIFTTDLDQRLLHPAEAQWNHNLVIVSHFDSQLSSRIQKSVAPFRDSYQTSLFLGVRLAVDSQAPTLLAPRAAAAPPAETPHSLLHELIDRDSSTTSPARLRSLPALTFEVSNQGAYRLGWQSDPIHPEKQSENLFSGWRRTTLACAAGLLCLLFLAPLTGVIRDLLCWPWRRFQFRYHHGLVLFAVFAAIPLTLVVYHAHFSETGEPFAAFAGISIWPTVYLRLFLICVCIYFLLSQQEEHDELTRRISGDFFATDVEPRASYLRPFAAMTLLSNAILAWRDARRAPMANSPRTSPHPRKQGDRDGVGDGDGVDLWREYLDRSTWRARHARVLPHLATALLIGIALFAIHGLAQPPIRDDSSRYASITSYFVSGVASLWLLLVVLDCVRLCKRWIELQAQEKASLPAEAIAQAALQQHWATSESDVARYRAEWLVSFQRFRAATTLANTIVRMTYAPFVVIAISFIARHNIFDNWEWNPPMVVMYAFAVGIAIYAVFTFGGVVRSYKERILDELRSAKGASQLTAEDVKNLDGLVKEVEETSGSALAPVQKNPIVAVALMPAGSVGVLSLIEQLAPVFIH